MSKAERTKNKCHHTGTTFKPHDNVDLSTILRDL